MNTAEEKSRKTKVHELVCQLWRSLKNFDYSGKPEYMTQSYSLHLNEQQRLHFLHKTPIPKQCNLDEFYKCSVSDDVQEQVLRHQGKHGLMFFNLPPSKPGRKSILPQELLKYWEEMSAALGEKRKDYGND